MKVVVKDLKTGATRELTADYCISCLPLTIVSKLDINLSPTTMAAVKAGGVQTASYGYNGRGERVSKTAGGQTVLTLYAPDGRWLGDYSATGQPLQQVGHEALRGEPQLRPGLPGLLDDGHDLRIGAMHTARNRGKGTNLQAIARAPRPAVK